MSPCDLFIWCEQESVPCDETFYVDVVPRGGAVFVIDISSPAFGFALDLDTAELRVSSTNAGDVRIPSGAVVIFNPLQYENGLRRLGKFHSTSSSMASFERRQWRAAQLGIEAYMEYACTCVNPPSTARNISNKIVQAMKLRNAGIRGIETLITNNLSRVEKKFNSDVVVVKKHLSESRNIEGTAVSLAAILSRSHRLRDSDNECPAILQRLLPGAEEYRAFVFGSEIVTVKMWNESLRHKAVRGHCHQIDLHAEEGSLASAQVVETDDVITSFARHLMPLWRIKMCAVDYKYQRGRLFIFEVNTCFTWDWLPAEARNVVDSSYKKMVKALFV